MAQAVTRACSTVRHASVAPRDGLRGSARSRRRTVLDLFSGTGTSTLGFGAVRVLVLFAFDIHPMRGRTIRHNAVWLSTAAECTHAC